MRFLFFQKSKKQINNNLIQNEICIHKEQPDTNMPREKGFPFLDELTRFCPIKESTVDGRLEVTWICKMVWANIW